MRRTAAALGLLGPAIASASPPAGAAKALTGWLDAGRHGEMDYMARRGESRADPRAWAGWARSVALLADPYDHGVPATTAADRAAISRYARGLDYHHVLRAKLELLAAPLRAAGLRALTFTDTSPLMERALAAAGGLGWVGRNGNLLRAPGGSFFFLGGLACDAAWPADAPVEEQCGTCDMCVTACPTGAIVAPGTVDARRCIAYLTIELKGAIPRPLRPAIGNRVFGCDDCQDICPFNAAPPVSRPDPAYRGECPEPPRLAELASLDPDEFRRAFRQTPVWRARRRGLLRNVMVALGNSRHPDALPALRRGLADAEPLVREHAAWGLGRIGGSEALAAVRTAQSGETDAAVRRELSLVRRELEAR